MSLIVQVDLRSIEGAKTMTTWLNYNDKLKLNSVISLKDYYPYGTEWRIVRVYHEQIMEGRDFDWHRKWTNNI
jgi:hypothetical protein